MNGLLLDTHVIVWLALHSTRIRKGILAQIAEHPSVQTSVASRWEFGIKAKRGTFVGLAEVDAAMAIWGFHSLIISDRHVRIAADLPLLHRDPFDRMLVAQAICEDLTLVTADALLAKYPCRTLHCGA